MIVTQTVYMTLEEARKESFSVEEIQAEAHETSTCRPSKGRKRKLPGQRCSTGKPFLDKKNIGVRYHPLIQIQHLLPSSKNRLPSLQTEPTKSVFWTVQKLRRERHQFLL